MLNPSIQKVQPNQRSKPIVSTILGIDEVGRGPWAGPLVVGAVILGTHWQKADTITSKGEQLLSYWQELTDSKKLTAKRRQKLDQVIQEQALAIGLGWVSAPEIDKYGLAVSLRLATRRAIKPILTQKIPFDEIIIDGTVNFLADTPLAEKVTMLKKGDILIKEISAASIVAKIARDEYMAKLAPRYPEYSFEKHVGYGTVLHKKALENYGITPEHRQSFRPIREIITQNSSSTIKCKILDKLPPNDLDEKSEPTYLDDDSSREIYHDSRPEKKPNSTDKGRLAENLTAKYLESLGHIILAHNFKTRTYEIDLISIKDEKIYFTEVKYRCDTAHGSALDQITPTKHQQMLYAAEKFLDTQFSILQEYFTQNPELDQQFQTSALTEPQKHSAQNLENLQPLLAVATVEGEPPIFQAWFPLEA